MAKRVSGAELSRVPLENTIGENLLYLDEKRRSGSPGPLFVYTPDVS